MKAKNPRFARWFLKPNELGFTRAGFLNNDFVTVLSHREEIA
jgi:hypothetical protein